MDSTSIMIFFAKPLSRYSRDIGFVTRAMIASTVKELAKKAGITESIIHMVKKATTSAVIVMLFAQAGLGLSQSGSLGQVHYTVFAPDWIWQTGSTAVNILVQLENDGASEATVVCSLEVPEETTDAFKLPESVGRPVVAVLAGGQTGRLALTGIAPVEGKPYGEYPFHLTLSAGDDMKEIEYSVRTVRGAVAPGTKGALLWPLVLCLGWSVVFVAVLSRYAGRGSWLRPSAVYKRESEAADWYRQDSGGGEK